MPHYMIISNPPHAGAIDKKRLGEFVGKLPMEAGIMARYPLPEIWGAELDEASAARRADILTDIGIRCRIASAEDLLSLPDPAIVDAFELTPDAMTLFEIGKPDGLRFSWDAVRFVSVWEMKNPKEGMGAPSLADKIKHANKIGSLRGQVLRGFGGGIIGGMVGRMIRNYEIKMANAAKKHFEEEVEKRRNRMLSGYSPFIDVFVRLEDGDLTRLRLQRDALDFKGLGDYIKPTSVANWETLLAIIRAALPADIIDDRAKDIAPRVSPHGLDFLVSASDSSILEPQVLIPLLSYLTSSKLDSQSMFSFDPYSATQAPGTTTVTDTSSVSASSMLPPADPYEPGRKRGGGRNANRKSFEF